MSNQNIRQLLSQGEGLHLEFKTVLPPPNTIARIIASFANADGGILVIGIRDDTSIQGLDEDTPVASVVEAAVARLRPRPRVNHYPIDIDRKTIHVVEVEKSNISITLQDGIVYVRSGAATIRTNPTPRRTLDASDYSRLKNLLRLIETLELESTESKINVLDHYTILLSLADQSSKTLFPSSPKRPTTIPEGEALIRMLFSSFLDTFEKYLSDLLLEIYLAKPETLKSSATITMEEVLKHHNMNDFVQYVANKKIEKLTKGNIKGFIDENKQIKGLAVFTKELIERLDLYFQIRHLYTHSNGRIDAKFIKSATGSWQIGDIHNMPIDEVCDMIELVCQTVDQLDKAAISKYKLSTTPS